MRFEPRLKSEPCRHGFLVYTHTGKADAVICAQKCIAAKGYKTVVEASFCASCPHHVPVQRQSADQPNQCKLVA